MDMITANEMREYQKQQKQLKRVNDIKKAEKLFNRVVRKINRRIYNCEPFETGIRLRNKELYGYNIMIHLIPMLRDYYEDLGYKCTNLYDDLCVRLLDGIEIGWDERSF